MSGRTPKPELQPDDVRMTLGEHLEELRGCVARSLIAVVLAALLCIYPAQYLLELIAAPLFIAQRKHGQPDTLLAMGPAEALLIYVKVVLISAPVIAAPYVLYEFWAFVSKGLYPQERRWVKRLFPFSVGLFGAGVAFMYFFVLLLSLDFLVGFASWMPAPKWGHPLQDLLLHQPAASRPAASQAAGGHAARPGVPAYADDPASPAEGEVWFNLRESRLKVRVGGRVHSVQLAPDASRAMITTHMRLGEYLGFVLILTVAFGAAFQMPLAVLFLARTGLVPLQTLRAYRKVAILVIVIIAGILAPPDVMSHLLLSLPMYLLFELGLLLAARSPKRESERAAA